MRSENAALIVIDLYNLGAYATLPPKRKDEVKKAMTIDMTFEAREEIIRKEEREAGRLQGIEQGIEQGIAQGIEQGIEQGIGKAARMLDELGMPKEKALETLLTQYPDYRDVVIRKINEVY